MRMNSTNNNTTAEVNPAKDTNPENNNKENYVQHWITESNFDDSSSGIKSSVVSSVTDSDSDSFEGDMQSLTIKVGNHDVENKVVANGENANAVNQIDVLQQIFNTTNASQTLGNVYIKQSKGVHVGNITYVTGPIHITQTSGGSIGAVYQSSAPNTDSTSQNKQEQRPPDQRSKESPPISPRVEGGQGEEGEEGERVEFNRCDAFLGNIHRVIDGNVLRIVNRCTWLAQRPLEPYDSIEGPAQYVIISHTATEEGITQAENVFLVRNIQTFHIESRRWNDISYNFLIGCDGNVYEGRGWNVVGAHTYGYNRKSVGISFIGCFMREKAPEHSLKACKLLIKKGIELGHISPNYILLGHCQCSPTESPGRMLFEEIQTWKNFSHDP